MQKSLRFRRTTLIIIGLVAFLGGLVFAKFWQSPGTLWPVLFLALTVSTFKNKKFAAATAIILLGFVLGWFRGAATTQKLAQYNYYYGQKIVVTGTAASDGVYGTNGQLTFDLNNVRIDGQELIGTVSTQGFGENAVFRGDYLQVNGKLSKTRGSKQAQISFAEIKLLSRNISAIERLRLRFSAGMQSALPEPQSSFGLGLLIGQRNTLAKQVSDQLSTTGLTHLIAVSGYNLTILVSAARRLTGKRSKYQTTLISLLLMGLFLLFVGPSASIIRAVIVSSLGLAAWYYGRTIRPVLLILMAAAITAGWNPLYIWSDIGWYLSFLAFYGILILAPLLTKRIYQAKKPPLLSTVFIESLSAQIMTMPLILFVFSKISLIGLLANILVVPLIPLAMLLSFVAALAGMFVPALSGWLAWPARLLLTYTLDLVSIFSRVPYASVNKSLSAVIMAFMYDLVLVVSFILWSKTKANHDKITDKEQESF